MIPFQAVDSVGSVVAVLDQATLAVRLGTEHLFAGLHEGDTLGSHIEDCCQMIHADAVGHAALRHSQGDPVKEGVVVVGARVADAVRVIDPREE